MLQTYRAILRGDQVEWVDEVPEQVKREHSLSVHVTILTALSPVAEAQMPGEQMAAALEALASTDEIGDLDPLAWQKEMRQERHLPGRDA